MLRITAPHFVAAIEPGIVAAPIIMYMLHWDKQEILRYCTKKGWKVEELCLKY